MYARVNVESELGVQRAIREAERKLTSLHGEREADVPLGTEAFGERLLRSRLAFRGGQLYVDSSWEGSLFAQATPLRAVPPTLRLRAARTLRALDEALSTSPLRSVRSFC